MRYWRQHKTVAVILAYLRCHAGSHPLCAHTYVCMHVNVCACVYMYNTPMASSYTGGGGGGGGRQCVIMHIAVV